MKQNIFVFWAKSSTGIPCSLDVDFEKMVTGLLSYRLEEKAQVFKGKMFLFRRNNLKRISMQASSPLHVWLTSFVCSKVEPLQYRHSRDIAKCPKWRGLCFI